VPLGKRAHDLWMVDDKSWIYTVLLDEMAYELKFQEAGMH